MTELSIDVSKLPTISDTNSWEVFMNGVEKSYTDGKISLSSYWRDYRNWIIFGLTLLAIGGIILLVTLLPSTTPMYPCRMYDTETMASTISVACLQYVWDNNCRLKQPYLFPQGYTGWWNQSPEGGAHGILSYVAFILWRRFIRKYYRLYAILSNQVQSVIYLSFYFCEG